ncbi:MAG: LexA family transcriptional regulator [Tepidisphaeraceae bacterium]
MPRVSELIFGQKLALARKSRGLTQRELGTAIGNVSDESVSRWERLEIAGLLPRQAPRLAKALGLTLKEFRAQIGVPLEEQASRSDTQSMAGFPRGVNMRALRPAWVAPEYQIGVAASRRVEKVADHPDANRPVATSDRRAFVVPVDGDCQSPKWKDGETVIFSYDAVDREGIIPGKSYYLAFVDGSTTFKRVFHDESDPDRYILRCWNTKKYPDEKRVHRDEVVSIARAVAKQVQVDEEE